MAGVMGLLQANEVIKLVAGIGEPLIGRLLLYESLGTRFTELKVKRDPECPICGEHAPEIEPERDGQVPRLRALLRRAGARGDAGRGLIERPGSFPAMPTVKIPPVLRARTDGKAEVAADGGTVGEVLEALAAAHPETRDQLFSGDGALNRYVNVYLNDEDVRVLDGLDTTVSDADTVVILPAMAGGAR